MSLPELLKEPKNWNWRYFGDLSDGTIELCKRKTKCHLCEEHMKKGDPRFKANEFIPGGGAYGRGRVISRYFHVRCAQFIIMLEIKRLMVIHDTLASTVGVPGDRDIPEDLKELLTSLAEMEVGGAE